MPEDNVNSSPTRKRLAFLLLIALVLYVVLPQIGVFKNSLAYLPEANKTFLLLALGFAFLTYLAAAANYCLLAFKRLWFFRTVLAQLASMFVNRLLPAGIGGIGANYVYLRKADHSLTQAASVVTANNLLGGVGHFILTAGLLIIFRGQLPHLALNSLVYKTVAIVGLSILLIALAVFAKRFKNSFIRQISAITVQLAAYRYRLSNLLAATISSMFLTLFNITCLWLCVHALGVHLSYLSVLFVFTLGLTIGTVTPTPGGLGGFEAGLVAALLAYNVPSSTALAIALVFRLVNYWIPLVVGAVAFATCRRRGYM